MEIQETDRVVGGWRGRRDGPLLVVTGGMHGNEPAGIPAGRRVLEALATMTPPFRGELVVLAGNLGALAMGARYVDEDLNRIWSPRRVGRLPASGTGGSREAAEQAALLNEVRRVIADPRDEICFLDLHTTSAPGAPFSVLSDTLENRRLASALPGTMVLGLDTHLDGTFLNFINGLGMAAVGFEGGQHHDPLSVDAHELAIWKTLAMLGCMNAPPGERVAELARRLDGATVGVPDSVEIVYRHPVSPGDSFVMQPGFRNLQHVHANALLARDRDGEIRAKQEGRILMPLYQAQGDDGFFLARDLS